MMATGVFGESSVKLFPETRQATYQCDRKLGKGKYFLALLNIGFELKLVPRDTK